MVRRFIEKEKVAASEKDAREFKATPFAAGERPDRQFQAVGAKAETIDELAGFGLSGITTIDLKSLLSVGESSDVLLRRGVFHCLAKSLKPLGGSVEAPAGEDVGDGEFFWINGVLTGILREVARSSRPLDGSALWVVIAAENSEKCGLPGTISPY